VNKWFEEPMASQLDKARSTARARRSIYRLTYDCRFARVNNGRVYCAKGYPLYGKRRKTMSLAMVLRGRTSPKCKTCQEFDGEPIESL